MSILLGIFMYRRINGKKIPNYLAIALIFALLGRSYYLLFLVSPSLLSPYQIDYVSSFFLIFICYFVYLHFEMLSHKKDFFWRNTIILILGVACLTLILVGFLNLYENLVAVYILRIIFVVFCLAYPLVVSYRTHLLTKERATLFELLSLVIVQISGILFLIYYSLTLVINSPIIVLLTDITSILIIVGIFLLLINYIIHSDFLYRLPFPIHYFVLINNAGIQVYTRHVSTMNIPKFDPNKELIMSGVLKAISVLTKETLGTHTKLLSIDVEAYQIFFSETPQDKGILAMISSGSNKYLQKSLTSFTNSIPDNLFEEINTIDYRIGFFDDKLDELLTQAFPYVVIIK